MAHDAKYHLLDPSHVFEAHDVVLAATYAQAKAYNRQWARERTAGAFGTVAQMFEQFFEALWELHGDGRQIALPAQRLATMKAALDDLGDPNLEARPHLPKVACSFMQAGAGLPAFERALTSKTLPQGEALLPAEAALLDACTAYRVRLSGLGLIEKGDALAYLLEHAAEAFPTCKKVCVLASAPLQPLHEHFLDELCRKGFIALERLTDNGEPCDSAQKTCVERAREGLAV